MDEPSQNHCNSSEESNNTSVPLQRNSEAASVASSNEIQRESESINIDMSSSRDALAKGLSTMLAAVMNDFDSRAQDTLKSQDQLGNAIDRLTGELDQLLEDAPLPFLLQHAAKISGVRKRVLSLNSVLKSIQRRIDNIDRMVSVGMQHEKPTTGSSRQQ